MFNAFSNADLLGELRRRGCAVGVLEPRDVINFCAEARADAAGAMRTFEGLRNSLEMEFDESARRFCAENF